MGCGGSKFDPEGKVIQSASIHPLLKRRILDQLRRRRRDALKEDPTLGHSTKKLLRYKSDAANDHKDRFSSASNTSLKLDHEENAEAKDEKTPLKSSTAPSDSDNADDGNSSNDDQPGLPKPTCKEHHEQASSLRDVNPTTSTATTTITTDTMTATTPAPLLPPPSLKEELDHNHDGKDTFVNHDADVVNTINLPVSLVTENKAVVVHEAKVADVNEHQEKGAGPAAAAENEKKDQDDEFLLVEEGGKEVVLLVVDEEEEDPSLLYPGSPSFRVYCINSSILSDDEDEDAQDDHYQNEEDDAIKLKTESDESGVTSESVNSSEGQELAGQRKNANWKRIRRLKKKIGRRGAGQVRVKQLLNVKACYNPATACTGGHERARLLVAHKQATVSS